MDKDIKTVDVMYRTALLTMSFLNEYFAKNKEPLTQKEFMKVQEKSFKEAVKLTKKRGDCFE